VSATGPAAQAETENILTGALRNLFALSEAYPDLKANQNFLALQEELTGTEGRIAYARQYYNDSVLSWNTGIQKFPASSSPACSTSRRRVLRSGRRVAGQHQGPVLTATDPMESLMRAVRSRSCSRRSPWPWRSS
jgi:hypothetical protein